MPEWLWPTISERLWRLTLTEVGLLLRLRKKTASVDSLGVPSGRARSGPVACSFAAPLVAARRPERARGPRPCHTLLCTPAAFMPSAEVPPTPRGRA